MLCVRRQVNIVMSKRKHTLCHNPRMKRTPATTDTRSLRIPLQSRISRIIGSILLILSSNCDIIICLKIFRKL